MTEVYSNTFDDQCCYDLYPEGTRETWVRESDVFVSGPGFNDARRHDSEIFQEMADWLMVAHEQQIKIKQIVYLCSITSLELHLKYERLRVVESICGKPFLKLLKIVIAGWQHEHFDYSIGFIQKLYNENKLANELTSNGAHFFVDDGRKDWVFDVLYDGEKADGHTNLKLQRQLTDERLSLSDTSAGRCLRNEILLEYQDMFNKLEEPMKSIGDIERYRERCTRIKAETTCFDIDLSMLQGPIYIVELKAQLETERDTNRRLVEENEGLKNVLGKKVEVPGMPKDSGQPMSVEES